MRASALLLVLSLSACAPRAVVPPSPSEALAAFPPRAPDPLAAAIAAAAVGRWVAVEIVGDARASRDLRRGTLEKVLVVERGGQVVLRGVDRGGRSEAVSFSGRLQGRVVTFAGLPGAALLSLDGPRLVLSDPSGRSTQFVRDAD